ncbi:MAG: hypothetical protein ACREE9_19985 [Stellaceae bacterium]
MERWRSRNHRFGRATERIPRVHHQIDALYYCLGEFRELTALAVSPRDRIALEATGEMIAKNGPDQLVVNGIVGEGTVVSLQLRGGMTRGIVFLSEIQNS